MLVIEVHYFSTDMSIVVLLGTFTETIYVPKTQLTTKLCDQQQAHVSGGSIQSKTHLG